MATRITMLFVLLSLASGVLAGMPLHQPNDAMMECCKRAKSKEQSKAAEASRLCCAMNCSTSTPTSSGASFNPAPTSLSITRSIADQIAALFTKEKPTPAVPSLSERRVLPLVVQPIFIRHHEFLI